jgi:nucleotide-binding universal stress UspA family protein
VNTIICGVDRSPGARSAVRVAAALAERLSARLVAVHVRDQSPPGGDPALRVATDIVAEEVPNVGAQARGAAGDVAERLAAIARSEDALMIVVGARRRGRSRAFLRARSAVGLVSLTDIPVLVAPLTTGSTNASPATTSGATRRSLLSPEAAPNVERGNDETSSRHVRPAGTTVAEQRRLRRTSGVRIRPAWSRGPFQSKRPHH